MRLTIQNFDKVNSALNIKLFDFGDWILDEVHSNDDAYSIIFENVHKRVPFAEVTLNRNKVDEYGYQLETKLWYSGKQWESIEELFLQPSDLKTEWDLLKLIEGIINGIKC